MVSRAYSNDLDHADDLFQEIWKRAFEKRGSFNSRGSFRAWLHRLATNVCIGDYRATKTHTSAVQKMGNETPEKEAHDTRGALDGELTKGELDPSTCLVSLGWH